MAQFFLCANYERARQCRSRLRKYIKAEDSGDAIDFATNVSMFSG